MKIGLKIWSTNDYYIESAIDLFKKGKFDYIELYIVPGSLDYVSKWESLEIPYVLHAPHSLSGLNPSLKSSEDNNFRLISELQQYTNCLNPGFIIFHPGLDGTIEETIRQFGIIRDKYPNIHKSMVVENKPKVGINREECVGSTPDEISMITNATKTRFCMDIGHAICAANSLKRDVTKFLQEFLKLNPVMFHLSDGDINSEKDKHLNFGSGNYKLPEIIKELPEGKYITIETEKTSKNNLDDFQKDCEWLFAALKDK